MAESPDSEWVRGDSSVMGRCSGAGSSAYGRPVPAALRATICCPMKIMSAGVYGALDENVHKLGGDIGSC